MTTIERIKDDRNAQHQSNITYFHSNPNNQGFNTDPIPSGQTITVFPNRPSNDCTIVPPPNNKKDQVPILSTQNTSFSVFPNPVDNILHYSIKTLDGSSPIVFNLYVYDISGRLLKTTTSDSLEGTINTTHLASGIYILQLSLGNEIFVSRFVKE